MRLSLLLLSLTLSSLLPVHAQETKKDAKQDTKKDNLPLYEKEMLAFEEQDRKNPPKPGGVVFYGSSSIRLWKLEDSFPGKGYVNRGFGGSQTEHAVKFFERAVLPHKPSTIVFYEGDNDLNAKKTPERVRDDYKAFIAKVRKYLPETRVVFIAIKPSPARQAIAEQQKKANEMIQAEMKGDPKQVYLDVWPGMLASDGKPKPEIFNKDNLHLNPEGYKIWAGLLKPLMEAVK